MLTEMIQFLRPHSSGVYLDGTLGDGGYTEQILRASGPDGMVIGLDLDFQAIARTRHRLSEYSARFRAAHAGFHEAKKIMEDLDIEAVDGAVLDLGLSSEQLEDPKRGFSFRSAGPLDMRFDTVAGQPLIEYLSTVSAHQLEEILATYGDERYSRKLARGILEARDRGKLETTEDLAGVIVRIIGARRGKIHPAKRAFQRC